MWPFTRSAPPTPDGAPPRRGAFLTHGGNPRLHAERVASFDQAIAHQPAVAATMDDSTGTAPTFKSVASSLPDEILGWYVEQRFIGYQTCAMISQHWLVDKACTMPARDAVRHGFDLQVYGDDVSLDEEQIRDITEKLKRADRRHQLTKNLVEFVRMGRVFGIRIAFFKVKSGDPAYYEKPFNPDGVTPGAYEGIVQVDPYWCVPMLSTESAADPSSMHFYEPEWWIIRGVKYHRSHLCIFRNGDVPDMLKPMYSYGGVSVPQRIFERVYAAERTANEGPQLAMTKRLTVQNTDLTAAYADQDAFAKHMTAFAHYRDNYGVKLADTDDTIQQFDTTLNDLDAVIMTQYQIVAAAAGVPATKLLGTTPKGFNSTGDYEAESYHEELETIQANDLTQLVNMHHLMVLRSEIGQPGVRVEVDWLPVDSPSAKEYAEIGKIHAETDTALVGLGAIDSIDVRNRLRGDKNSNYTDLHELERVDPLEDDDPLKDLLNGEESPEDPLNPDA